MLYPFPSTLMLETGSLGLATLREGSPSDQRTTQSLKLMMQMRIRAGFGRLTAGRKSRPFLAHSEMKVHH